MDDQEKGEPVIPFIDVYKAKMQSDGNLDKLNSRTVVRGDFQNKGMVGDTSSLTSSMRTLKFLLADTSNHKSRVYQLDFIEAFLKSNLKHRVFVKLDSRYGEYFPEYGNYFGRPLRKKQLIYVNE